MVAVVEVLEDYPETELQRLNYWITDYGDWITSEIQMSGLISLAQSNYPLSLHKNEINLSMDGLIMSLIRRGTGAQLIIIHSQNVCFSSKNYLPPTVSHYDCQLGYCQDDNAHQKFVMITSASTPPGPVSTANTWPALSLNQGIKILLNDSWVPR